MVSSTGGTSREAQLDDVVRASQLPVALIDLGTQRVITMSGSAGAVFGLAPDAAAGRGIFELSDEPDKTRAALAAMGNGAVDAYEARRRLRRADGSTIDGYQWVRHLVLDGYAERALVLLSGYPIEPGGGDRAFADCAGVDATVGTADADGHIDRISSDVEALLGYPYAHFVGTGLVGLAHPIDAQRLQEAIDQAVNERASLELRLLAQRADGTRRAIRMFLSAEPDESPTRLGFTIAGVPEAVQTVEQRAKDLEATLRRIAAEMQSVGITAGMAQLPPAASVPELADLSTRQWEIVTRLLRGDRVPAIARAMFLSPHTVRNHLSAVYKKLGVHSQQELIERLRGDEDGPSRRR